MRARRPALIMGCTPPAAPPGCWRLLPDLSEWHNNNDGSRSVSNPVRRDSGRLGGRCDDLGGVSCRPGFQRAGPGKERQVRRHLGDFRGRHLDPQQSLLRTPGRQRQYRTGAALPRRCRGRPGRPGPPAGLPGQRTEDDRSADPLQPGALCRRGEVPGLLPAPARCLARRAHP
ncbi:hypothetical protein D9M71_562300 [compost metagenome]